MVLKALSGASLKECQEELQRIVAKDYSSNLGKASVNRAMDWLYSSGIIGFAGKITNCNILDFRAKARCYFMDTGLAFFFLKQIGCVDSDIDGIINENFVYLDLKRRSGSLGELVFEMPAFAIWGRVLPMAVSQAMFIQSPYMESQNSNFKYVRPGKMEGT